MRNKNKARRFVCLADARESAGNKHIYKYTYFINPTVRGMEEMILEACLQRTQRQIEKRKEYTAFWC